MQTLEEKFRILADAARDGSEIVVQEQLFRGNAEGFTNAMQSVPEMPDWFNEPIVSIIQLHTHSPEAPAPKDEQRYPLSLAERDAVLAGLRLLQKHMGPNLDAEIIDIMCDNGPGVSDEDIDHLCRKLNQW